MYRAFQVKCFSGVLFVFSAKQNLFNGFIHITDVLTEPFFHDVVLMNLDVQVFQLFLNGFGDRRIIEYIDLGRRWEREQSQSLFTTESIRSDDWED